VNAHTDGQNNLQTVASSSPQQASALGRTKRMSLCMSVQGFLRTAAYPKEYKGVFEHEGKTLSPSEAKAFLMIEQAKGRSVIPCSKECGNPCKHAENGCTGFDYSGKGCPGRYINEEASANEH
jgi:hypothetical protein